MVLPPLDLEWIVLQYEITNGPILHKSNINNIGTNPTYNFVTVSQYWNVK